MPQTFTLDKSRIKVIHLYRDGVNPVVAVGEYDVLTSAGQFPQGRSITFPLTSPVQNTLNGLWDSAATLINNQEGTTTLVSS